MLEGSHDRHVPLSDQTAQVWRPTPYPSYLAVFRRLKRSVPQDLIDTLYRGIKNIDLPSVQVAPILYLLAWIRHVPN
jgi:hypothetical protein